MFCFLLVKLIDEGTYLAEEPSRQLVNLWLFHLCFFEVGLKVLTVAVPSLKFALC